MNLIFAILAPFGSVGDPSSVIIAILNVIDKVLGLIYVCFIPFLIPQRRPQRNGRYHRSDKAVRYVDRIER